MIKRIVYFLIVPAILASCNGSHDENTVKTEKTAPAGDSVVAASPEGTPQSSKALPPLNDTLNAIANIIAGISSDSPSLFPFVTDTKGFETFHNTFEKRWESYDSSRLQKLQQFRSTEIASLVKPQKTLFYPFSGPDILYAYTFFPDVEHYVMIGLEPVGSLPVFKASESDSLAPYFNKINTSLNAILKYSFFRTESMSKDLRNQEVNGTLHLLLLFLKRTGNSIASAKPLTIDSTGKVVYLPSFDALKTLKSPTKGVEIVFVTKDGQAKTLNYFSLNAADGGLKYNKGMTTYLHDLGPVNTYLKGASYLMHKSYFSMIRNVILDQSQYVIQDDSGIAFHYFSESGKTWQYTFFGKYLHPIPMFSQFYQKDLDSTYKAQGSRDIGFGIGYNFKDRNSNFMIAKRVN